MSYNASQRVSQVGKVGLPPLSWRRTLSPTGNTGDAIFRVLLLSAATLILLIVVTMIFASSVCS